MAMDLLRLLQLDNTSAPSRQRQIKLVLIIAIVLYFGSAFAFTFAFLSTRSTTSNAQSEVQDLSVNTASSLPSGSLIELPHESMYLTNSTVIVAGTVTKLRVVPNSKPAQRTAYLLVIEHDLERQFLFPSSTDLNDGVEFSINMFVAGTFKAALFSEGLLHHDSAPWELPGWDKKSYFDAPKLDKLHQFELHIAEPSATSSPQERLEKHLKKLPICKPAMLENLQQGGRYISSDLFPYTSSSSRAGSRLVFLPANCQLYYYTPQESHTCLHSKNITFLGDSTLEENMTDLVSRLAFKLGDARIPEPVTECPLSKCGNREQSFPMPGRPGKPNYFITHIWGATEIPCWNGQGASAFRNPLFVEWTKFKVSYPEFCHHWEDKLSFPAEEYFPKGGRWEQKLSRKQDVLVYTSGLHDLSAFATKPELNYTLTDYEGQIDYVMKELKDLAKLKVYVAVNPFVGRHGFPARYINDAAKRLSKKHGFLYLDQNGAQLHRLGVSGDPVMGDWIHAHATDHSRTAYTNANSMIFLNALCSK
ncbi:hypothetical protein HDU79_005162 [Rhizoclosmatium sp. JEL0117]|nr:hypothetical protein HDU79_005162 [Rhizoclosmatium sp. JEL0117]